MRIRNYCIQYNIGTIVIGHNPGQKQGVNLGKKTNQNFVSIPFHQFINMIKYKAEEIGIEIKEQEESHTSKCSFLDDESVEHHDIYVGERVNRGIFRSKLGSINSDVNGALNIIKKAIPNAFKRIKSYNVDGIEDVWLHPLRINPLIINTSSKMLSRNIGIIEG